MSLKEELCDLKEEHKGLKQEVKEVNLKLGEMGETADSLKNKMSHKSERVKILESYTNELMNENKKLRSSNVGNSRTVFQKNGNKKQRNRK